MASFAAIFNFEGTEYNVMSCVYTFGQSTDEKGRPSSDVMGGTINLQIAAPEESAILGWMIDPYAKKKRFYHFQKN